MRDVLVRVDTTNSAKPEFIPATAERAFRMFVSDYTMVTLMPHLLALAYQVAPKVRFELLPQVNEPLRLLNRGEVDLLVIPLIYCAPDYPAQILLNEDFCCVVDSASALARRPLTLDAYKVAGHVVMQPPGASPPFEGAAMQQLGIVRRVEVSTFSFAGALSLLAGTDRTCTVHRRLAIYGQRLLPLTELDLPLRLPTMEQAMRWHAYRSNDPGLVWLRGLLQQVVFRMDNI